MSSYSILIACIFCWVCATANLCAQRETPYFVTYSSVLEEPGNLEVENQELTAGPRNANGFISHTAEFEYGVTAWWTTEVYLQGQSTDHDSTVFTGWRLENRFRPLPREYWINPVLYLEYEDTNAADKSVLEVTGNDTITTFQVSNALLRSEVERAIEGKLILSSNIHGVNVSENFIAEGATNENEPVEFGYALAASRPLAARAQALPRWFSLQNWSAGAELFGGLGTTHQFGLKQTEQYAAPIVAWTSPRGWTLRFSPEIGLDDNSAGVLWRLGASYEIQQIRDWFRRPR